jgi:hypothetical protein
MNAKINSALLCIVIALQVYSLRHRTEVGRFQWLDTPGKQLGFDTATGKRCWVWSDVAETNDKGITTDVPLCAALSAK